MSRRNQHRDRRAGFALVEVMFALVLIAVMATLALPGMVRATGPAALRITAFEVAAILREDRNVAQSTGRTVKTTAGEDGRRVFSGDATASVGLPEGATLEMTDGAASGLRFYADGRSSGGSILIVSATARYAIDVNRDTGAIRVREP